MNSRKVLLSSATLEIRPIIDKAIGRRFFAVNPLMTQALRGPDAGGGFESEPAAAVAYEVSKDLLSVGLQYFGAVGPIRDFLPPAEQTHILHPNVEIGLGKTMILNVGARIGSMDAAERLILTARFGYTF